MRDRTIESRALPPTLLLLLFLYHVILSSREKKCKGITLENAKRRKYTLRSKWLKMTCYILKLLKIDSLYLHLRCDWKVKFAQYLLFS